MLIEGFGFDDLSNIEKQKALELHTGIGLVILILAIIRLCWRFYFPPPPYPKSMKNWQIIAARLMAYALYTLMLLQPALGILQATTYSEFQISAFNYIDLSIFNDSNPVLRSIFNYMHSIGASALALLLIIHILAALKHGIIDRDGVLTRMLPLVKTSK